MLGNHRKDHVIGKSREREAARIEELEREVTRLRELVKQTEKRFELATLASSDGSFDWNIETGEVYYSDRFLALLDLDRAQIANDFSGFRERLHPEDRDRVMAEVHRHLSQDVPFDTVYRIRTRDGNHRWFRARGATQRDPTGKPTRMAGAIADLTERRQAEEKARLSQEAYRALFQTVDHGIAIIDIDGRFLDANPAFLKLVQRDFEGLRALDYRDLTPQEYLHLDEEAVQSMAERDYAEPYEKEYRLPNGERVPVELRCWLTRDDEGAPREMFAIVRDISSEKEAREQIHKLAYYDFVTGLPNRQLFHAHLQYAIDQARTYQDILALLFIDLDRFKQVNDTLGHSAGDKLLQEVGNRFSGALRSSDRVFRSGSDKPGSAVARLGGDEFTVILSKLQRREDAQAVARRLVETLEAPFSIEENEVFVSGCVGIALFPDDGLDVISLTRSADTAMYHAKDLGRASVAYYSESMGAAGVERMLLENGLRKALEERELHMVYQPQRGAVTGAVTGCEALVRWNHKGERFVPPDQFIPIAEDTGLIIPIGDWIFREVCEQWVRWVQEGYAPPRVGINVSARQITHPTFLRTFEKTLDECGVPREALELEITETVLLHEIAETKRVLDAIHADGIEIALDDFGTGFSSLSHLQRFPIDRLKIDRSFVNDITTDPEDRCLTAAIIGLAHNLGIRVVAEGVETEEQAELLREQGCDDLQGYLISKPVSAEEFVRFLEREKPS